MENMNCDVDENVAWSSGPPRQSLKIQYLQAFHLLLWTFLFDIWPFFVILISYYVENVEKLLQ